MRSTVPMQNVTRTALRTYMRPFRTAAAILLLTVFSGLVSAPVQAHDAAKYLPATDGPVTLIVPDRLADAPFFPDASKMPLLQMYESLRGKLSAKHIELTVYSAAIFDEGFLLHSSATPAIVRYALKYKIFGDKITYAEAGDPEKPVFSLSIPDNGIFAISFPAKGWLLFAAVKIPPAKDAPSEQAKAAIPAKTTPTEKPEALEKTTPTEKTEATEKTAPTEKPASMRLLLEKLPEDVVTAYLWPNPGETQEYPLMGRIDSISFYIRHLPKEKRPVLAEIVMPMKSHADAIEIQSACQASFDKVYKNAALLGPIPENLVNAFTVTRTDSTVTIRISLPDDLAKFFFSQFSSALENAVKPFAVPEKFRK